MTPALRGASTDMARAPRVDPTEMANAPRVDATEMAHGQHDLAMLKMKMV
jgi:hypothetical protein